MNPNRMPDYDPDLAEEVAWFRGFGWTADRIARRLEAPVWLIREYIAHPPQSDAAIDALRTAQALAWEKRIVSRAALEAKRERRSLLRRPA